MNSIWNKEEVKIEEYHPKGRGESRYWNLLLREYSIYILSRFRLLTGEDIAWMLKSPPLWPCGCERGDFGYFSTFMPIW
jgi:hypothetical protein